MVGYFLQTPLPNNTTGNTGSSFTLDPTTGELIWDAPQKEGAYVVAIKIKEYRNGQLITSIVRDMVIDVHPSFTNNTPPVFTIANDNITAEAGETIQFELLIEDGADDVAVTATGGPFQAAPPATVSLPPGPQSTPLTVEFNWETSMADGREQPYQVVFTAVDNGDESMMWQKSVFITVQPEPLSEDEAIDNTHATFFPNPTSGLVNFEIHQDALTNGLLKIFNANGQPVFQQQLTGQKEPSFDLQTLSNGMYYFQIMKGELVNEGVFVIKR